VLPSVDPRIRQVSDAVDAWRVELVRLGGENAMVDIAALGDTVLDVSAAHPSGIAQLYAGRTTPLTNLVRERHALSAARASARALQAHADHHASRYGLPPTHLSIGIAFWLEYPPADVASDAGPRLAASDGQAEVVPLTKPEPPAPIQRRVPVLLRPISVVDSARDVELTLEHSVEVNPVLVRALRARGVAVDPAALAAEAFTGYSFNPHPVLERLIALGKTVLADFRIREKLIVGVFEHPGQLIVEDLDAAQNVLVNRTIVAALAGDRGARRAFSGQQLPPVVASDRTPDHERGIGDLGIDQQHVLDVVAAGHSVFLDAPPGAPAAATVAGMIADAIGSGRSVLYVTGNRRASHSVSATLRSAGLGEAILDLEPRPGWQHAAVERLREGLDVEAPPLDVAGIGQIRSALAERSRQIAEYIRALHGPREPWNISAYDALQAIARVTSQRPGTRTAVRLDYGACVALGEQGLEPARNQIIRLATLGAFRLRRADTAWYGSRIVDAGEAATALRHLDRLREGALATTLEHMRAVADQSGLALPATIEGWGEQLDMLAGIRQALDVFKPMVFERAPDSMVAATATAEWRGANGVDMGRMDRSRLRKQAKDMVRPGVVVPDLHAALVHLQSQREIWVRWNPTGAWPKLPDDMAGIDSHYRAVRADVDALNAIAPPRIEGATLATLPLSDLERHLERLHSSRGSLAFVPEIHRIKAELKAGGMGELLADLRTRRVGLAPKRLEPGAELDDAGPSHGDLSDRDREVAELAGHELDLAWWSSALGFILQADPVLSAYNGDALAALIDSYRELDVAHIATKPAPIRTALAARRDEVRRTHPGQSGALESMRTDTPLRTVMTVGPDMALAARPCWIAGPMLVPLALPLAEVSAPLIDLVVLDSMDHVAVSQAVPALARASQVVVVGDSTRLARGPASAAAALAEFLPKVPLSAPPSRRDPRLARFLAEHGYPTLGRQLPLPSRDSLVTFTAVDGVGQVRPGTSSVESADGEVEAVVREAVAHVRLRGTESLAIVAASAWHGERVRDALERVAVGVPEIAAALSAENVEPLVVAELDHVAGIVRDAVIFTPGFAKTPHGHVIYDFGPISSPGGASLLLDALTAARHRLVVVSALASTDLAPARLKDPGSQLFAEILAFAASPPADAAGSQQPGDALLADLARRIVSRGFQVAVRFGVDDAARIPLAISHPSIPERALVAVLSDDPDFVREPSVRVQARLRSAELERLGWRTVHAWSPAVFMDPEAEARAITGAAWEELERLRPGIGSPGARGVR
jgi:hypothetical protein